MNDTHGNVRDSKDGIGIAKTTTLINNLRQDKETILISEGDMWQGSVESNYTKGNLFTDWMNYMGFVSMTVGNHEFDWGEDPIRDNVSKANFPFLGINVINRASGQRVDYLDASTVVEKAGLKIGIIGAIGNCYSSISSSRVKDIRFAVQNELTNLVKNESRRLRNEEQCDFIIYSVHGSLERDDKETYDISLSNDHYVDLVLEGHTHQQYAYRDAGGIYHIQGKGSNGTLNMVDVNFYPTSKRYVVNNTSYTTTSYTGLAEDTQTNTIMDNYRDAYEFAYGVIGYNGRYRNSTYLRLVLASLYLQYGQNRWPTYNIFLGGGYMSARSPYNLEEGNVTYADIQSIFPFDNNIVLCSLKGDSLKENFLTSRDNYYTSLSTYGQSIDYSEVEDNETYYIVTDTYCSDYSYNRLTVVDVLSDGFYARDMLAEYIRDGHFEY